MAENEKAKIKIYLKLDGEMAKRFLLIKKYFGLKNDTEVLRRIITDFWDKHHTKIQENRKHKERES